MDNKLNVTNKFQQEIYSFIKAYHPSILEDKKQADEIIIDRANKAQKEYSRQIRNGEPHILALESANEVLHAGLEFSPTEYIVQLYEDIKGIEIDTKKSIEIYRKTKKIFDEYGHDFEGSDEEDNLITKLLPYINE